MLEFEEHGAEKSKRPLRQSDVLLIFYFVGNENWAQQKDGTTMVCCFLHHSPAALPALMVVSLLLESPLRLHPSLPPEPTNGGGGLGQDWGQSGTGPRSLEELLLFLLWHLTATNLLACCLLHTSPPYSFSVHRCSAPPGGTDSSLWIETPQ